MLLYLKDVVRHAVTLCRDTMKLFLDSTVAFGMQDVEAPVVEPAKAKKKRKSKAKVEIRADTDAAQKAAEAAALAREEALRKVEEEQQALRAARAKQRELEEELLEKRKQVHISDSSPCVLLAPSS